VSAVVDTIFALIRGAEGVGNATFFLSREGVSSKFMIPRYLIEVTNFVIKVLHIFLLHRAIRFVIPRFLLTWPALDMKTELPGPWFAPQETQL
jgi:hypothetical protein